MFMINKKAFCWSWRETCCAHYQIWFGSDFVHRNGFTFIRFGTLLGLPSGCVSQFLFLYCFYCLCMDYFWDELSKRYC